MRVVGQCFFAGREVVGGTPPGYCWGPMQRCHLIPKQQLRGLTDREVWDERIWVPGCWGHHQAFDHFRFELVRAELPAAAEEYAAEHGVLHLLDGRYGATRETSA